MVLYPYSFQAAFDPNTATTAPRDSVGQVYPVGDTSFANPLPTFDLNGMPVPLVVGEHGYLPDFQVEDHTAVVWRSGEYVFQFATTIPVKGDEGEPGKSAYQLAQESGFEGTKDEWLESLKGANVLPTDEAIAAALTDGGLAQAATKALADASAHAEVAPVVEQVQQLEQSVGQSTTQATQAANRTYTVTRKPAAGGIPEHVIIRLANGAGAGRTINKVTGGDSLSNIPPRETLDAYYARTQASVIINASGYWPTFGNRIMGLSIVNGQLVQGWDPEVSNLGHEAAVLMKDGSLRMYDDTTPPEQILADGGWNSFSWGSAAYKNGAITDFQTLSQYHPDTPRITGRQLIGDTLDGDFLIITFPGQTDVYGAHAQHILAAVAGLKINNLYILDGGGSAQTMVDGKYVVPSSDGAPRAVPDALYFYAPRSGRYRDTGTGFVQITDRGSGFSGGEVSYQIRDDSVRIRVFGVSVTGPVTLARVATMPPECPRPLVPWNWLAYLNSKPENPQNCRVTTAGTIDTSASVSGTLYFTIDYPI